MKRCGPPSARPPRFAIGGKSHQELPLVVQQGGGMDVKRAPANKATGAQEQEQEQERGIHSIRSAHLHSSTLRLAPLEINHSASPRPPQLTMTASETVPTFDALAESLLDLSQPMGKRTRAVFYLRSRGQKEDLQVLLKALLNKKDSELMRHELAYVIGQFQDADACETLQTIVEDVEDDCMVRHEAAEALGAIGHEQSIPVLEKFAKDPAPEVSETCELALRLVKYKLEKAQGAIVEGEHDRNPYLSVDPAPAASKDVPTETLKATLLDPTKSLFDRYRAMFSLRNRNTPDAALALAEGYNDSSALFRHEVAYVMGQMENPVTVPSLKKVLMDHNEHRMVRHEAAEALGAIGTPECEEILQVYLKDSEQVVRESCEVALDIIDYWAPTK